MTARFAWLAAALLAAGAVQAAPPDAAQVAEGKALFQQKATPTCATCHTLHDAGASGNIGPDLDELKPSRDQILAVLKDGSGVMPSFADQLSAEQMNAIAAYVFSATHP